ncbi:mitochondrial inner membrane protease subunit 2 isoform X2 [Xiphias gladius]|uniref:mitochondrial inner membrane protease subunit 2 isoform X2 n=1 Tax=Xiphias gladius TaxID=8245 RepID=UPI001A99D4BF|nr:mitochondrial inner membrane protease subunit 2 isoform X2 [Xiphias gladius]
MAQQAMAGRRYLRAFVSGFFVAVPVTVTVLDRFAYVARVEGASMQPFLNPEGGSECDVVLLNRWSVRNYQVQRGDIVSVMSPRNPQQKIIKRVIGLEGDFIRQLARRIHQRTNQSAPPHQHPSYKFTKHRPPPPVAMSARFLVLCQVQRTLKSL